MATPGITTSTSIPETRTAQSLSAALLLSFTGGFLDAFLYVTHGHIFAGALTGNFVLAGIALLGRDSADIVHHLLPILGFVAGICSAFFAGIRLRHHVVLVALVLESVGLLIASLLPSSFPDPLFIVLLSGLAGYQVGSFRKVDSFVYNATFITGNVVRAVESFHSAQLRIHLRRSMRECRDFAWIVALFFAGVMLAAVLAGRLGNHALWVPMTAVLVVLAMAVRGDLRYAEAAERKMGEPN
jgi:uncharacterized membrane protein YoaK (UPF0700 family)